MSSIIANSSGCATMTMFPLNTNETEMSPEDQEKERKEKSRSRRAIVIIVVGLLLIIAMGFIIHKIGIKASLLSLTVVLVIWATYAIGSKLGKETQPQSTDSVENPAVMKSGRKRENV